MPGVPGVEIPHIIRFLYVLLIASEDEVLEVFPGFLPRRARLGNVNFPAFFTPVPLFFPRVHTRSGCPMAHRSVRDPAAEGPGRHVHHARGDISDPASVEGNFFVSHDHAHGIGVLGVVRVASPPGKQLREIVGVREHGHIV